MITYEVDTTIWVPVTLINAEDRFSPETGVAAGDLSFNYGVLEGGGSSDWHSISLDSNSWKEMGNGVYEARILSGLNDTKGVLVYMVEHDDETTLPYSGAVQIVDHDPEDAITTLTTNLATLQTDMTATKDDASITRRVTCGRWKIENTLLKLYDADDSNSVLYTFELLDSGGNATDEEPFERNPLQ